MYHQKEVSNQHRVVARIEYRSYAKGREFQVYAFMIGEKDRLLYSGSDEVLAEIAANDEVVRCS